MTFQQLHQELHALMMSKHDARDVKLLNVGTDNPREYHWRFKTPDGEIVNVSVTKERPELP